jgi:REP element-mobilizing transposase RayT
VVVLAKLGVAKLGVAKLGLGVPAWRLGDPVKTKGWYSRGYLPHFDALGALQFITFRLADSLPQEVLDRIEKELEQMPMTERELARYKKIERWLDSSLGCCALRQALLTQETLQHADGKSYRLIEWCIMPNHVHVLIEQKISLPKILQSWKSYTGRWAMAHNAELGLGVPPGHFWMREYWDRFIRDEDHFNRVVNYIRENPVKAGLCDKASDWPWSSAYTGLSL